MATRRRTSEPAVSEQPAGVEQSQSYFAMQQKIRDACPHLSEGRIGLLLAHRNPDNVLFVLESCAKRGWNAYAFERSLGIQNPESHMDGPPVFTLRIPQMPSIQPGGPFLKPPLGNLGETPKETQRLASERYVALVPKKEPTQAEIEAKVLADVPF